jgi:hypothetical protein
MPFMVSLAAAPVVALGLGLAAVRLFPLPRRGPPATASIDGARVVAADRASGKATLFCTSSSWANDLAAEHGAKPRPCGRKNRAYWSLALSGMISTPLVYFVVWLAQNR